MRGKNDIRVSCFCGITRITGNYRYLCSMKNCIRQSPQTLKHNFAGFTVIRLEVDFRSVRICHSDGPQASTAVCNLYNQESNFCL